MSIGTVKAPNAEAARLEKLVARWWELAEIGYPRNGTNRVGWADHLERLAAEPQNRDGESKNEPAPGVHPPKHENRERQLTQGSMDAEGLAPFLAFLSQPR